MALDDMDSGDDNHDVQVSKAVVLQKSIEFIQYLGSQKKKQEAQLSSLRKEVMITLNPDIGKQIFQQL